MTDPDDRETGFYWISLAGQTAEVAHWQVEWSAWLVTGKTRPLTDEVCINLQVLGACLVPPPHPHEDLKQLHHES